MVEKGGGVHQVIRPVMDQCALSQQGASARLNHNLTCVDLACFNRPCHNVRVKSSLSFCWILRTEDLFFCQKSND